MSLLRLLTAGRSLVGLKKAEVRYHLPGHRTLPRFGSKKNPFRATVLPEKCEPPRESAGPLPEDRASKETGGGSQNEAPAGGGQAQSDSAKVLASNGSRQEQVGTSGEKPRSRGSAVKALLLWGRAQKARRSAGTAGKPLVQGELSLDRVRVIRNDLSESDLEIVPARPAGETMVPVPSKTTRAKPVYPGSGWGVAAGRLLGLGKM